uniref:Acyltransferase n=1 Tax=Mesocestoides corti TaxID=53468 RepID=A0A5K3EGV9_MESCO
MGEVVGWYDHSVLYRFRARFAVFLFGCSIVILPFVCFGAYVSLFLYPLFQMTFGQPIADMYSCFCFLVILIYTVYWIWDIDTPYRGGRRIKWLRNLPLWKWVADYFAARLIVSEELCTWAKENGYEVGENLELVKLPTSVNYLVGYHPHGPLAIGALMAYGSDSLNFSKVFPGIKPHMATLNGHYDVPFYRDYALFGGGVSVSRESLIYLLDKELTGVTGNLVAVSVGGATEALESRPGHYVLMLSRRRGFFRIALKTGAHLIPSLGFGETNMYDQVANPVGSVLRRVQDWFTHTFTFSPPIFYSWRVIPYRKPLNVVVGKPIVCKRTPSPTDEEIDNLREQYKQQLTDMFFKYRPLYDPTAEDIRFY